MDCPTSFRGIKSVGLCAGDEIRTRDTCLEGKGDDLFTTPAIGGDGLCLRAGKHYMQRKNVYDHSKLLWDGRLAIRNPFPAESEGFEPSNRMKRLTP